MSNLLDYIKDASPSNRNFDCAYVAIANDKGELLGTYVQGFYQLALVGGLRCQIEEDRKIFNEDGTKKSAFELAVIHKIHEDDIHNAIRAEYAYQNERGIVPQEVSKYRVVPEWLSNLKPAAKSKLVMVGDPQRTTVTINNFDPKNHYKPKPRDRALHSTMQILGLLVTLTTFVGLLVAILPTAFLATLPAAALAGVLVGGAALGFYTLKTMGLGNVISFFGIGEVLWTDVRALTSEQFLKKDGRISWGKLAKSAVFALAIGGLAFMAASAVFSSTLALPLIAGLGLAGKITAGFFATVSFVSACIGASIPVRTFSGFGIWDNTIPVAEINAAAEHIKPLRKAKYDESLAPKDCNKKGDILKANPYILFSRIAKPDADRKVEKYAEKADAYDKFCMKLR